MVTTTLTPGSLIPGSPTWFRVRVPVRVRVRVRVRLRLRVGVRLSVRLAHLHARLAHEVDGVHDDDGEDHRRARDPLLLDVLDPRGVRPLEAGHVRVHLVGDDLSLSLSLTW